MNYHTEKENLIRQTLSVLEQLSAQHILEVKDYADSLRKKLADKSLAKGMENLMSDAEAFSFLEEDEVEYSKEDLKRKFQ